MVLSPADFYAYSEATGVPVPDTFEERAALTRDVLNFRRNQLKTAPEAQEGPNPLALGLGIGLGLAGLAGAGVAARRLLRSGKAGGKAGVTKIDLSQYSKEIIARAAGATASPADVPPSKTVADLVDIQQTNRAPVIEQQQAAVESGANQTINRFNKKIQRNEDTDVQTVADFLERERDEIASQLGEQNLVPSPLRIERELAKRTGDVNSWQYGPEYTQIKHTLELGAQDPKFFTQSDRQVISIGGNDWELGVRDVMLDDPNVAFKRPVINSDTAARAEDYYQTKTNNIKDWLGNVRLDTQGDVVRINNEQSAIRQRINQLREQENILMYEAAQSPGRKLKSEPMLNAVQDELDDLVNRFDETQQFKESIDRRVIGAQNFAQNAIDEVTKTFPTTLTDWSGEGFVVRPKGQVSSTFVDDEGKVRELVQTSTKVADFGPEDLEVAPAGLKVVDNLVRDPETGALMEAASGTSIRGRSGIPFSIEAKEQELGMRAKEAASKIAYVDSLKPVGAATTDSPVRQQMFGEQTRGGIGIYGIEAEGYPAGAVTREGEYTRQATQRPTFTYGATSQSPQDVLKVDPETGVRRATRAPEPPMKSPLLDLSDDQLNEMVLMGAATGGEAEQIGLEADRILRNRGEASALERQAQRLSSVRMSEAVRRASQMSGARNPRGGVLPDEMTVLRRQMASMEPSEVTYGPRIEYDFSAPAQLGLPGVTGYAARARKSPADIAAEQLESYMGKLQRGRSTPLTSQAVIQPKLF